MSEKSEAPPPAAPLQAGPVPVRVLGLPLAMGVASAGPERTANSNSRVALAPVGPASSPQGDTVRADARRDGRPAPEPALLRPKPQAEASRLDALLVTNQIDTYCKQINQFAGQMFPKLFLSYDM